MTKPSAFQVLSKKHLFINMGVSLCGLLFAIVVLDYSFKLNNKMFIRIAPLIDAAMEIKLEGALAHFALEEIISGSRDDSIERVQKHLANTAWYAEAMLEGGKNPEGNFVPLVNDSMREDIAKVQLIINKFTEITNARYLASLNPESTVVIDQEYHDLFDQFITLADRVETKLQVTFAEDYARLSISHYSLMGLLVLFTVASCFVVVRYEKHWLHQTLLIQRASEEVKTLRGLIPICSACKKIRSDQGLWDQIESYISERSEAEFTHSICPDCAKELYPEFYKEDST